MLVAICLNIVGVMGTADSGLVSGRQRSISGQHRRPATPPAEQSTARQPPARQPPARQPPAAPLAPAPVRRVPMQRSATPQDRTVPSGFVPRDRPEPPTRPIPQSRPTPQARSVPQARSAPQARPFPQARPEYQTRPEYQNRPEYQGRPVHQGRPAAPRPGSAPWPGTVPQGRPAGQGRPTVHPRAVSPHHESARVLRPYQPRSFEMPTRAMPQIQHAQPVFVDDSGRRGLFLAWASIIAAVGALLLVGAFWLSQATSPGIGGPPVACAADSAQRCNAPTGV